MKIQKFLTTLVAAAALMVSCEKAPEGLQLPANVKTDLNFTLSITEVTYNSAQVSVKHDGTTNDTWYGFLTDETEGNVASLIAKKVAELTAAGGDIQGLESRTSKRVNLKDLEADTKYRYIVFAIAPNGILYGNMASIELQTTKGFLMNTVEDWTVKYEGRDASKNSENYSVEFKSGATRCHVGFIPKWRVEMLEEENREIIDEYGGLPLEFEGLGMLLFTPLDYFVFQELLTYWGFYDEDESYFNQETLKDGSVINIGRRQESGDYYAVAIGFKSNKEPTFTYSVNEVNIPKETPSAEYSKWLGTWIITGANNIKYTLKFEEYDPNFEYLVYGWECGAVHNDKCDKTTCTDHINTNIDDLYKDGYKHSVPFYFDALTKKLNIYSLIMQVQPSNDNTYYQYWGLHGFTEYENKTICNTVADDIIATAQTPSESSTTLVGNNSTAPGENVEFTYTALGYTLYNVSNNQEQTISNITLMNEPLTLPATLVKSTEGKAASKSAPVPYYKTESAARYYQKTKDADYSILKKAEFLR